MVDANKIQDSPSATEISCPNCGARLPAGLTVCWLCFAPLESKKNQGVLDQFRSGTNIKNASAGATGGFSLASLMMFVTLLCVVLGVFTIAPGLGVPLAIVAFVTWLRTVSVVKSRAVNRLVVDVREYQFLIFVRSVAFTLLVLALVGVAAVAAFATRLLWSS